MCLPMMKKGLPLLSYSEEMSKTGIDIKNLRGTENSNVWAYSFLAMAKQSEIMWLYSVATPLIRMAFKPSF